MEYCEATKIMRDNFIYYYKTIVQLKQAEEGKCIPCSLLSKKGIHVYTELFLR